LPTNISHQNTTCQEFDQLINNWNSNSAMSSNHKDQNNHLIDVISHLSSQANESSNIVLQAISQGIMTGISQGIASGNISLSFQDVIALATAFKPSNDVPLSIIDRMIPKNHDTSSPPNIQQSISVATENDGAAKALANHNSLGVCLGSLGLPSSVHVFDVTDEKCPACECTASHRVSENAGDSNAVSSISSNSSTGLFDETLLSSTNPSRKRTINYVMDDETAIQTNSRRRLEMVEVPKCIECVHELSDYVSLSTDCNLPEAISMENNNFVKNNGESTHI